MGSLFASGDEAQSSVPAMEAPTSALLATGGAARLAQVEVVGSASLRRASVWLAEEMVSARVGWAHHQSRGRSKWRPSSMASGAVRASAQAGGQLWSLLPQSLLPRLRAEYPLELRRWWCFGPSSPAASLRCQGLGIGSPAPARASLQSLLALAHVVPSNAANPLSLLLIFLFTQSELWERAATAALRLWLPTSGLLKRSTALGTWGGTQWRATAYCKLFFNYFFLEWATSRTAPRTTR